MSDPKSFHLDSRVHAYLVAHGTPPDAVQLALIEETKSLGGVSIMQIAPEQGAFMTLLARLIGAKRAVEVGTFTGYSALCIARGLPEDGELLCCDVNEEWTGIAKRYWEKAGVAHKVTLKVAPAEQTLGQLPSEPLFDFAFIDADKPSYPVYFEQILARLRPNGVVLVDNVLWAGAVADPSAQDANTLAIRRFNDLVKDDRRVECVMLPVADGLTFLRKK
jgi:predicted O-methyltransferase YrrM